MTLQTLNNTRELAQQLRVDSVRCTTAAGSGHPTSSMSAADLMAVLLARHLRYDEYRKPGSADGRAQRRRLYAHQKLVVVGGSSGMGRDTAQQNAGRWR
jgi:transketolase N-terminal domain/subunit